MQSLIRILTPRFGSYQPILIVSLSLFGCGSQNRYEPPPPSVTVSLPVRQTVTNYLEATGTTEAVELVEIRARVRGFLDQIIFEDGAVVEKGQKLYQIEPELFQAEVDASQAELAAMVAQRDKARIEQERQERLQRENPGATSEVAVVAAQAESRASEAAVQAAKATLDQAQINLNYTDVVSPIAGRVDRTLVKRGNLVGNDEATHLTTVVDYDPIYAYFNISERALLSLLDKSPRDKKERSEKKIVDAELRRANDSDFRFKGNVDYADLGVDQSTGTYLVRGVFPNADHQILPGLFVRVRIPLGEQKDAILVPERAVGADQSGRFVLVVDENNMVDRRNVVTGAKHDNLMIVSKGLLVMNGSLPMVSRGLEPVPRFHRRKPARRRLRAQRPTVQSERQRFAKCVVTILN